MMTFEKFLKSLYESEEVKLDRELAEYTLAHFSDALFNLEGPNLKKDFSVKPYNNESLDDLLKVRKKLEDSIDSLDINDLYSSITAAERVPYSYGNIFAGNFSLKNVPSLSVKLQGDEQATMMTSEKEFLYNTYSTLSKVIKDDILNALKERAEVLCVVIEALFYYIRSVDKDNYYDGMNRDEILETCKEHLEKASKEVGFSVDGPFSSPNDRSIVSGDTKEAFWICEKDQKNFIVSSVISPKNLNSTSTSHDLQGIKFSISSKKLVADVTSSKKPADKVGYLEVISLPGIGQVVAKFDTGNGSKASSLSFDNADVDESSKTVRWELGSKKFTSKITEFVETEVGDTVQRRPVILMDIVFNGETYRDCEVALVMRPNKSTKFLANRKLLEKIGLPVVSDGKFIVTTFDGDYSPLKAKEDPHAGIKFQDDDSFTNFKIEDLADRIKKFFTKRK
jgi:hypothetical protein